MNTGWLSLTEQQRLVTLQQASARSGMHIKAIEKDWWVTLCLEALFSTPYAQYCTFKGGTSLSKGWNLIQRFSEDVDIALDPEAFGMTYKAAPSHSFVKKLKRMGCQFTSTLLKAALEEALVSKGVPPGVLAIEAEKIEPDQPDKDPQTLYIRYPSIIDPHPYLKDEVKMEFGVRALKLPFAAIPVQSILSQLFPNPAYAEIPFTVTAAEPRKTLLEKMFLLHEKLSQRYPPIIRGERQSRHLYDIAQLMNTHIGREALQDAALYQVLLEHRRNYMRLKDVDYDTLQYPTLHFVPFIEQVALFREDYAVMQESMIYGPSPDFDELLHQLKLFNGQVRLTGTGMKLDDVIEAFMAEHKNVIDADKEKNILRSFLDAKTPAGKSICVEIEMHRVRKEWLFQNITIVNPLK